MKKLIILIFIALNLFGKNYSEKFNTANKLYIDKKYSDAIAEYESILGDSIESSELHFNLGNAYFKLNKIGKSILHFEKAKKLNPTDEDILFNLRFANSRKIDKIDVIPQLFLVSWFQSSCEFLKTSVGFFGLYLILIAGIIACLILYFFQKVNRKLFLAGIFILFSTVISIIIYEVGENISSNKTEAIVTTAIVNVKLSPSTDSEDAFLLHEGTKFIILDKVNEWHKLELSDGKIGWLENFNFGKI